MLDNPKRQQLGEATHRLEQLDVLLAEVVAAIEEYGRSPSVERKRLAVKVKTLAEAFYYFASRAVDMLEGVYGTDSVKRGHGRKLIGVVMVRNRLIEHGEKRDGFMPINWEFDTPKLVVLKPFGGGKARTAFDRGLWANAQELHHQIGSLLSRTGKK